MATPRGPAIRNFDLELQYTPHLMASQSNHYSSSSPMIATPAKAFDNMMDFMPKGTGSSSILMGPGLIELTHGNNATATQASATSVASNSSQDSHASSYTSHAPASRPQSASSMLESKRRPSSDHGAERQLKLEDVGLGFGQNIKFGFQTIRHDSPAQSSQASGVRMVPATPPPPGSTTPGSMSTKGVMERFLTGDRGRDSSIDAQGPIKLAAESEAMERSEAEEAAAILVNSVATTPRHHGRNCSVPSFPNMMEQEGDHTSHVFTHSDDIRVTSTPGLGLGGQSPVPSLPSFCSSSPATSTTAPPSREQPGLRTGGVLPMTSPSHVSNPFAHPPSSSHSLSETSLASAASTSKSKKKATAKRSLAPYEGDPHAKPPFSYAGLIGQAILSMEDHRMSLNDIYLFIMTRYPYYKKEDSGWQNSIRHNLSLNECFIKTPRDANNPGKGCLWSVLEGTEDQFEGGNFVKRSAMSKKKMLAASSTPLSASQQTLDYSQDGDPFVGSAVENSSQPALVLKRQNAKRSTRTKLPSKRAADSRDVSEEPSLSGEGMYEEEDVESDVETVGNSSVDAAYGEAPSVRKRPRVAPPPQPLPGEGLPLPVYPPRQLPLTSPAIHYRDQIQPSRKTRTSPPPYLEPTRSPPTAIIRRMSNPYAAPPPRPPSAAAQAIMSSPPAGGIMQPHRYWPSGADAPGGYLQAAPLIRAGHRRQTSSARDVQDDDNDEPPTNATRVTMSPSTAVTTHSPVSSLRSAFQPTASPLQARIGHGREYDHAGSSGIGLARGGRSMSPPPPRSTPAHYPEDALLRTPPSERTAVFSTPRRTMVSSTPGRFSTPAGWTSSSQYDPYDHGGAVTAEVDRVSQGRKGMPPTPKFSTPGMNAMTPW